MLVGPQGQSVVLMSDVPRDDPVCGGDAVGLILTFDDAAAGPIPLDSALVSGTFRPTNNETYVTNCAPAPDVDAFPGPAPSSPYGSRWPFTTAQTRTALGASMSSMTAAETPARLETDGASISPLRLRHPDLRTRRSPTSRSNTKLARPASPSQVRGGAGRFPSSASWTRSHSGPAPHLRGTSTFGQGNTRSRFVLLTRLLRPIRPRQARDSGSPARGTRGTGAPTTS